MTDRTNFYAQAGGQPGDTGLLRWAGGEARITNTTKGSEDSVLHVPEAGAALPPVGAEVTLELEWPRRLRLMRMHTTLHLLCSLIPGAGVTGGQIGLEKSRLDFDLPEPPSKESLTEALNGLIAANHPITQAWISEAELDANPSLVRTLSVQPPRGAGRIRLVRIGSAEAPIDLQPCGGTHVRRTGDIGLFKIIAEGAVSAGVRRVEAVTGDAALAYINEMEESLTAAAAVLKAQPGELAGRIAALVEERRKLERDVAELRKKLATGGGGAEIEEVAGLRLSLRDLGEVPPRDLKGLAEAILKGGTADVVALISTAEGKASIVVAVAEAAKGRADAVALVRAASAAVGGKGGGGRPDMAQAGGPDAAQAAEALAAVKAALAG